MVSVQDQLTEAVSLHQAGRLADAGRLYEEVLRQVPNHPDALHLHGLVRFRSGDPQGALALMELALSHDADMAQAHYNRANVLRALERSGAAVTALRHAVVCAPDQPLYWSELGETLASLERVGEATAAFAAVSALSPDDPRPRFRMGQTAEAAGWPRRAAAAFRQALVLKPDFTEAHQRYVETAAEVARADAVVATVAANRRRVAAGGGGPAPNIYLKGYSRPFYLDRLICSIKRHVTGYDRIIVINDGIAPIYMNKIKKLHNEIEIRNSPKVESGIFAAPANDAFLKRKKYFRQLDYLDPSRFWLREIARDPNDYVIIIDEDCWFFLDIDLDRMANDMRAEGCLSCAMMYEKEEARATRKAESKPYRRGPVGAVAGVDYRHHDGLPLRWQTGYQVFISTQCMVMKEYWLNNYEGVLHFTNEMHLNQRAIRLYADIVGRAEVSVAAADGGMVRHSTSSTSRSDAGGNICLNKIDPDLYHDLVSERWLNDEFDCMSDFPNDYSTERLVGMMRGRIDDALIKEWIEWREEFLKMFHWL